MVVPTVIHVKKIVSKISSKDFSTRMLNIKFLDVTFKILVVKRQFFAWTLSIFIL